MGEADRPITDEFLKASGFKLGGRDGTHRVLWLGWCPRQRGRDTADIGLELAAGRSGDGEWFCWIVQEDPRRSVHVRGVRFEREVIVLVEALTDKAWDPKHHWYGIVRTPDDAERLAKEEADREQRRKAGD